VGIYFRVESPARVLWQFFTHWTMLAPEWPWILERQRRHGRLRTCEASFGRLIERMGLSDSIADSGSLSLVFLFTGK